MHKLKIVMSNPHLLESWQEILYLTVSNHVFAPLVGLRSHLFSR